MTETYKKYLYNQFRETYAFTGVPISLFLKGKEKKDRPEPSNVKVSRNRHQDDEEGEGDVEEGQEEFRDHESDYRFENED